MNKATSSGLEGVVVAETAISDVDGERGKLVIAGADVEMLAASATFEDAAARVLAAGGATIDRPSAMLRVAARPGEAGAFDRDALPGELARARRAAWEVLPRLGDALDAPDGMDALRASLAHLRSAGDDTRDAFAILGAAPVFAAAWSRHRRGLAPVAPSLPGHAADYLAMTTGDAPGREAIAGLDAYLVTIVDHAMSASTFTARAIASTGSDLVSAIVGAVGALKGPLHGGAPGPVLDMLDAVGSPERAEAWLLGELAAGRRIMGMGHRVYRVRDPRAAVLERTVDRISATLRVAARPGGAGAFARLASPRLQLARAVEAAASKILRERKPDRSLAANVEFYTAVLLDAVGLPREQFSPTFAVGRVAGWSAHVIEQRRTGRLIRPASRYVGA